MEQSTLPPEIAAELENLRDIHLPDPVGWWPLATGVWVLIALVSALALSLWGWRALRRRALRYRALAELDVLAKDPRLEGKALAERIEVLLKRLFLQRDPQLAASHGERWIESLTTGDAPMPEDIARAIAQAPYAPTLPAIAERNKLIAAARRWIGRNA